MNKVETTFRIPLPPQPGDMAGPAPAASGGGDFVRAIASPPAAATSPEDVKARMQRAQDERAKRDAKYREQDEARRLDFHELLLNLEDSTGGRRGRDFAILDAGKFGFVAVARKEAVLWKTYRGKLMKDKYVITPEDAMAFVRPQVVYPTLQRFDEISGEVMAIIDVCANALVELFGVKEQDDAGK